jgi:arsenical pump membrane protein
VDGQPALGRHPQVGGPLRSRDRGVARGWPEAVAAVPAAGVVYAGGAISTGTAATQARQLGPVSGFMAAVLELAQPCDDGLFRACGAWMARAGQPKRLLSYVFVIAAVTTAVLSLDATSPSPGSRR